MSERTFQLLLLLSIIYNLENGKVAQITKERESWWVYGKASQHTHKTIHQSINQSISVSLFISKSSTDPKIHK